MWQKLLKSSYICVFILSKKQRNWFYKNLHNAGMIGRRKLLDPSLNCIFNALSIGVQFTLSFQWTNFGLKCLIRSFRRRFYSQRWILRWSFVEQLYQLTFFRTPLGFSKKNFLSIFGDKSYIFLLFLGQKRSLNITLPKMIRKRNL